MTDKRKKWLRAAGIRAAKTFVQSFCSAIGVTAAIDEINWITVVSVAVSSGILSILTSLAGLPEVDGTIEIQDESEAEDDADEDEPIG